MTGATGVPHRCSYCDRHGHKRPTCPTRIADEQYAAGERTVVLVLSPYEASVAFDNLYERLRDEDEADWENDDVARALLSITNQLRAKGVSR